MDLVKAMGWAETQCRQATIANAIDMARFPDLITANTLK